LKQTRVCAWTSCLGNQCLYNNRNSKCAKCVCTNIHTYVLYSLCLDDNFVHLYMQHSDLDLRWRKAEWGSCSKTCGEAHQHRKVDCVHTNRHHDTVSYMYTIHSPITRTALTQGAARIMMCKYSVCGN